MLALLSLCHMPENKDSDWDWSEFVARNNNELVAHGATSPTGVSFCYRNWNGQVPEVAISDLRPATLICLTSLRPAFESIGRELESVRLRSASRTMRLASIVNQYLDQTAPWTTSSKTG